MPYAPTTPNRVDAHIAEGFDAIAKSIDEYKRTQQQAEMQHGYVQQAVQSGVLDPAALADFAKGNANKKLQIGADAQIALKNYLDMEQHKLQKERLGEQKRQFDIERPPGWTPSTMVNEIGGGARVMTTRNSPFSASAQVLPGTEPTPAEDLVVKMDAATGKPFYLKGGQWHPLRDEEADPMKAVMAQILSKQAGVNAPAAGGPPMPPAPAAPAKGNLPTITTAAQYQAIPAGSQYRDKDGNVRTKR